MAYVREHNEQERGENVKSAERKWRAAIAAAASAAMRVESWE